MTTRMGRHLAMPLPVDLKQIKDAVRELRVSCPQSALADLVEEKIRALESGELSAGNEPRDFPFLWQRSATTADVFKKPSRMI